MIALEFLAHDMAGMLLVEVDGECEWMGTLTQRNNAHFVMSYYEENGHFPKYQEDFAPDND